MKYPKVSIITVNYKQPRVTCELLNSIANLKYPNIETIVVDNAQTYDDSPLYEIHLPGVKVINCKENLGFAGGNNVGINAANGEYVLLLNNDTEIENGVIEGLLRTFKENKHVGAVSPILRYFDAPEKIQFAGFTKINSVTGRNDLIQQQPPSQLTNSPYFHGAAVMIPMKVIQDCGLMPEEYFLYYEELEWSRLISEKGYAIKIYNAVSVLHKESITTGKNSPLKVYYQNRNRVHFMRKGSNFLYFLGFFLLVSIPKNILIHSLKKEWQHVRAYVSAFKHSVISPKYGQQAF